MHLQQPEAQHLAVSLRYTVRHDQHEDAVEYLLHASPRLQGRAPQRLRADITDWKEILSGKGLQLQSEDKCADAGETEVYFLLSAFANMAMSRLVGLLRHFSFFCFVKCEERSPDQVKVNVS